MKTTPVVSVVAVLIGGAALLFAPPAFAGEVPPADLVPAVVEPKDQVCEEGDSGKIDLGGGHATFEITADEGYVITAYCVKAGSEEQGDGPQYYEVDPPQVSVVIAHSTGKDISHYSFTQELAPTPTPTPTPTPEPTPTPTTPPAGGGDGGGKLAETGFDAGWLPFVGIGALALGAALVVPRLVAKRR